LKGIKYVMMVISGG